MSNYTYDFEKNQLKFNILLNGYTKKYDAIIEFNDTKQPNQLFGNKFDGDGRHLGKECDFQFILTGNDEELFRDTMSFDDKYHILPDIKNSPSLAYQTLATICPSKSINPLEINTGNLHKFVTPIKQALSTVMDKIQSGELNEQLRDVYFEDIEAFENIGLSFRQFTNELSNSAEYNKFLNDFDKTLETIYSTNNIVVTQHINKLDDIIPEFIVCSTKDIPQHNISEGRYGGNVNNCIIKNTPTEYTFINSGSRADNTNFTGVNYIENSSIINSVVHNSYIDHGYVNLSLLNNTFIDSPLELTNSDLTGVIALSQAEQIGIIGVSTPETNHPAKTYLSITTLKEPSKIDNIKANNVILVGRNQLVSSSLIKVDYSNPNLSKDKIRVISNNQIIEYENDIDKTNLDLIQKKWWKEGFDNVKKSIKFGSLIGAMSVAAGIAHAGDLSKYNIEDYTRYNTHNIVVIDEDGINEVRSCVNLLKPELKSCLLANGTIDNNERSYTMTRIDTSGNKPIYDVTFNDTGEKLHNIQVGDSRLVGNGFDTLALNKNLINPINQVDHTLPTQITANQSLASVVKPMSDTTNATQKIIDQQIELTKGRNI